MTGIRKTSNGVVVTSNGIAQTTLSGGLPESFEGTALDDWSGDTGDFSANTTIVEDQSQSIEHTVTTTESYISYDPEPTTQNQAYLVAFYLTGESRYPKLYLNSSGTTGNDRSGYAVELNSASGTNSLKIRQVDSGAQSELASSSCDYPLNQWLYLLMEVQSGPYIRAKVFSNSALTDIVATVEYDASAEATTYTSGDTGLGGYNAVSSAGELYDNLQKSSWTVQVMDDFEDTSDTEWNGFTGETYVTDSVSGGQSLQLTDFQGAYGNRTSTSGLANYFAKGNIANYYMKWPTTVGGFPGPRWGCTSDTEGYEIEWDGSTCSIIDRTDSSTTTPIGSFSATASAGTWYKFHIEWDDGTLGGTDNDIRIDIRDFDDGNTILGSTTVNNASHAANNGIGIRMNSNNDVRWDYFHLE